nr:uncharacterized protein LOC131782708 [Pocillopora verrucosa]
MAVLVTTCCCDSSLRGGVMILGIFGLIASSYSIYYHNQLIKVYKHVEEKPDKISQDLPFSEKHLPAMVSLIYVSLAFGVMSLLVNLLLLGSSSGDRCLAFPWLGWNICELFCSFVVIIFYISIWNRYDIFLVIYGIAWLLWIYFIIVVYSYIEALREDPSGTSAGFSPPLTGGNQTQMDE